MVNNDKSHRTDDSGQCSSEEAGDAQVESPTMQGDGPDGEMSHRDMDRGEASADAQGDCFDTEDGVDAKLCKRKTKELSHRDIEKRRRDRINRSLWKLKDLIPSAMQKQENGKPAGSRSGRLEKAEVLELTVDYLLQIGGKCKTETGVDVLSGAQRKRSADAIQSNEVIAESAKEVYLAGFRDGVQHTADAMVSASVLSVEEKRRLVANLDLANICVPRIFLTHAKRRKRAASEHDLTAGPCRSDASSQSSLSLNQSSLASRERFRQTKAGDSGIGNEPGHGLASSMSRQSVSGESTSRDSVVVTDSSEQSGWSDESGEGSGSTDDRVGSSLSSEGSMQTPLSFSAHPHADSPFPNSLKAPENASAVADAIVLPAYVLDADRTRYVPVILPQSLLLSSLLSSLKGGALNSGTLNSSVNHDLKSLYAEVKSSESGESRVERKERNDLAALKGRRVTGDDHDGKRIRVISSATKRDLGSPRSRMEHAYNGSQQSHYDLMPNASQRSAGVINRGNHTESSGSSPDWVSRDCKPWALNRQPINSSIIHDDALYNMQESLRHVSFASSSHSVCKRGDSHRDLDYRELFMPGCPRPSESLFDYQPRYYPLTPGD